MKILPNNSSLIYSGRIDVSDPFAIVWTYPGIFVRMKFKGTQLFIHVRNKHNYWNNYLGVAEGDAQTKLLLPEEGEAMIELLEASPLPPRRIEVYGDSVSAGEVSEAIDYVAKADPEHNGEYSNSWYSYAWIAARKLDAQLHDIAQGGVALLDNTGWYHEPDYIGMEHVWNKMRYDSLYGQVTDWDFSKYTPDIVIVAIGQNDSHPDDYMKTDYEGEKAKNWRTHYRQFLAKLRETYPDAWIVCCTTLLQHDIGWDMSISQAVQDLGDKKVSHCVFQRNGKATPGHLRIPEAEEMAKELCQHIRALGIEGYEA